MSCFLACCKLTAGKFKWDISSVHTSPKPIVENWWEMSTRSVNGAFAQWVTSRVWCHLTEMSIKLKRQLSEPCKNKNITFVVCYLVLSRFLAYLLLYCGHSGLHCLARGPRGIKSSIKDWYPGARHGEEACWCTSGGREDFGSGDRGAELWPKAALLLPGSQITFVPERPRLALKSSEALEVGRT